MSEKIEEFIAQQIGKIFLFIAIVVGMFLGSWATKRDLKERGILKTVQKQEQVEEHNASDNPVAAYKN